MKFLNKVSHDDLKERDGRCERRHCQQHEKDDAEEEQIITNSIYTVLDIQEYDNIKLIYLCNHWDKGKFSRSYGPDDEVWESNKKLKENGQLRKNESCICY